MGGSDSILPVLLHPSSVVLLVFLDTAINKKSKAASTFHSAELKSIILLSLECFKGTEAVFGTTLRNQNRVGLDIFHCRFTAIIV